VAVVVRPRLVPDRLSYTVRRGTVYRFRGTVIPDLAGETVQLWTDRGGSWRLIDEGREVKLNAESRWVSRRFGTPVRETYRLRARVPATSRHGAASSPVVTVTIR
jgi:hypothetical protein